MPAVMLLVFALTLFLSASLLFIIEPMVGKMMLPLMGGTPAVWNTCMVFFQAILLAGYGFAHVSTKTLGPRQQARLQLAVVLLPFLSFALNGLFAFGMLSPNESLVAGQEGNPIPILLMVLTIAFGVPMFVICTTAPLLQRWFSSTDHPAAQDPYFLYGASNFGSMLALIGYPFLIEPYMTLKMQQLLLVGGIGLLALAVALCAYLMWKSKPAVEFATATPAPPKPEPIPTPASPPGKPATSAIRASDKNVSRDKTRAAAKPAPVEDAPVEEERLTAPVNWKRRLHWIGLAAVPSSLMLGATTYITTDLAPIPFLWMPPLLLYLMTFIFVFMVVSPKTQSRIVFAGVCLGCLTVFLGSTFFFEIPVLQFALVVLSAVCIAFGTRILQFRDPNLIHKVMIILMPLLLLLLLFMMLTEWKEQLRGRPFAMFGWEYQVSISGLIVTIGLHLLALFIVSMVCHGALAADRPAPKHLTEFFLLMSVGGVIGGLFNGLIAPVIFNSIVEYQLCMVIACLLLPSLSGGHEGPYARYIDVALGVTILLIGGVLLYVRYKDTKTSPPDLDPFWNGTGWIWATVALLGGVAIWLPQFIRRMRQPSEPDGEVVGDYRLSVLLDLLMPAALLILVLGLYWGLPADGVKGRIQAIATFAQSRGKMTVPVDKLTQQLMGVLTFGLPAVLCYTFVERWTRFGLGVGAMLLAAGYSGMIREGALFQDRSFFGVLKVEDSFIYYPETNQPEYRFRVHRLVHGTTLHGKQYADPELRNLPTSYYHSTGPVGQIFRNYNDDIKQHLAVIGLGTGTVAAYAKPGQRIDYYDIDPVVVDIAYDTNKFFHFIEDAQDRGADIGLILGDARLTFDPRNWRERRRISEAPGSQAPPPIKDDVLQKRLLPLRKREGEPTPARKYGADLASQDKYRLIFIDAFSSDAIPMHLITRQALQIYIDRLSEDGILCIHISNRYLDLQPVLANIAVELGLEGMHMSDDDADAPGKNRAHWVALSRKQSNMDKLRQQPRWRSDSDLLPLLGLAAFPAQTLGPNPVTSMSWAFAALADIQGTMGAKLVDPTQNPNLTTSGWEPLETTPYLEALPDLTKKEVLQIENQLASIEKDQGKVSGPLSDLEKQVKPLIDEGGEILKQLRDISEQLAEGLTGDIQKQLVENQTRLSKQRKELDTKLEPLLKKKEALEAQKNWLDRAESVLNARKKRLASALEQSGEKIKKNRRVGVWTDDYSNLLSVFSW